MKLNWTVPKNTRNYAIIEATHRSALSTLSHFNINKTALAHYVNTVSLWSKTKKKAAREKNLAIMCVRGVQEHSALL